MSVSHPTSNYNSMFIHRTINAAIDNWSYAH